MIQISFNFMYIHVSLFTGSDWTFELLRTLIEKKTTEICSTSSLEGSPSPSPPTHPFWATVKHLTPSTLHTLHTRTCKNLLSSLSQCYLPLFGTNPTYQLQGTLYKHMTQTLSASTNSCTTLEDLIRAMAAIYTLADCGSCLVMPQNDGEYEKLMKQVVARGPKVVYEAYNNCVQEELKSSSCLTSSRGVLKVWVRFLLYPPLSSPFFPTISLSTHSFLVFLCL